MRGVEIQWRVPGKGVHIPSLDGLRTLAILPVLLIHLDFARGGFIGVTLFFALSGFLIASLLLEELERTNTIQLKPFYVRRMARLYPALLAAIVLGVVVGISTGQDPVRMILAAVVAGTYTANLLASVSGLWLPVLNHTWTLAQEEQFYLVAPWIMRKMRMSRLRAWAIGVLALAGLVSAMRLIVTLSIPELYRFTYENPFLNLDSMLAGVAFAMILKSGVVPRWIGVVSRSTTAVFLALATLVGITFFARLDGWTMSVGTSLGTLATLVLIGNISSGEGVLTRFLGLQWMRWLGERVYGIYLYHVPLFALLGLTKIDDIPTRAIYGIAATALVILLAAASARWVEQPVRDWAKARSNRTLVHSGTVQPRG